MSKGQFVKCVEYDTGEYYFPLHWIVYCLTFLYCVFSNVWNHIMWQCNGEYDCPLTMYEYCDACEAKRQTKKQSWQKCHMAKRIHIPWRSWLLFFGFVFLWGFALFQEFHRAFALKWENKCLHKFSINKCERKLPRNVVSAVQPSFDQQ